MINLICPIHKCEKKWLLTSVYCPKCEEAFNKAVQPEIIFEEKIGPVKRKEFKFINIDLPGASDIKYSSIRTQWEAKYGKFLGFKAELVVTSRGFLWEPITNRTNPFTTGYPQAVILKSGMPRGWPMDKWHDSISRVWPI